ncbi:putative disease resistance protein RGA1 [Quercus lobata]|uniref:putative disease resistance protein RGA1 n=1 Tax=Quercus lobata TaxID=97700 RepID=UPI001248D881|nr:putative disease resistance protein RGA1 [Quercus lobata]
MADTLLIDLFKQLGSIAVQLAKQEINLLVGVDEEVQKLQDRLGMIKAMLDDAEERHAVKQRTEKLWLEKLQISTMRWMTSWTRGTLQGSEQRLREKKENQLILTLLLLSRRRQPDVVERPTTTSFVDVSNIIGRDIYWDELLRSLLSVGSLEERNSYCVISLVGLGGIGKTTLAQLAYNHPEVQDHFQKRMWVCISDPFDQCKVAKAIIKEVDPEHGPLDNIELQSLLCKIHDLIKDKKFFLVLDDVWIEDFEKWEPFKSALKNGVHGSRILATTRNQIVANMMESALTINLEVLSDEDCWLIFSKIAFSNEEELKYLEDLGRKLAIKCNGLPLVAKTLGSLMHNKRNREQWNKILDSHMWELEDIEKGLLAPLLLSYYELPSTMRRCFSYCAIFSKDYLFSRDKLVLHWMAQGYVESKENMEMEVIAEEYFENYGLEKLPQGMSKLINLRHLIFDQNSHLVFPKGVGKLIDLRTLWVFNIGDKDDREGCKFGELKNLNQLQGTLRINGLENVVDVGEVQNAQLKKKIHLRGLVLWFSPLDSLEDEEDIRRMENDILVLNALEPPPHLQDLEIGGYMGNIIYPNWMMSCTTLKRLQLLRCVKLEHLPSLGQLPFLEVLKISWLLNAKKVGDEFLGIEDSKNKKDYDIIFPNLKSLEFWDLYNWEE